MHQAALGSYDFRLSIVLSRKQSRFTIKLTSHHGSKADDRRPRADDELCLAAKKNLLKSA